MSQPLCKQKYPVDKLEYTLREKEDKHMVGQKPFPGVGPVDGMHPSPQSADVSDELKRKQMLSRASALSAKFAYATNEDGSRNLGDSAWEVYRGDKLILTATVQDLSGGQVDRLYSKIATKEFGASLIEKVRANGVEKVAALVKGTPITKGAQGAELPPPAADAGPAPGSEVADTGKSGDPKESLLETAEKARNLMDDVVEGVRALTGEKSEMGAPDAAPAADMESTASFGTATLNNLRRELNSSITHAMKDCRC